MDTTGTTEIILADYECCEHCAADPCITAPHATSCQHGCNDETTEV
jgi:hypothetical protein